MRHKNPSAIRPYFSINESEARLIAGTSRAWGNLETGGELVGLFTHGGRPVVLLATPPGPGARHERTHFQQDLEAFERRIAALDKWGSLQVVGTWHSHHDLGLNEPSQGDVEQVRSITSGNGYSTWVEIIAAHDGTANRPESTWTAARVGSTSCRPARIRMNAFFYVDPLRGEYVRCPIKILPGSSPFRRALLESNVLSEIDLGVQGGVFPREDLVFDDLAASDRKMAKSVPSTLVDHLERLPKQVVEAVEIVPSDDSIRLTLPLAHEHRVHVVYVRADLLAPQSVVLSAGRGNKLRDVTAFCKAHEAHTLPEIYQLMAHEQPPNEGVIERIKYRGRNKAFNARCANEGQEPKQPSTEDDER